MDNAVDKVVLKFKLCAIYLPEFHYTFHNILCTFMIGFQKSLLLNKGNFMQQFHFGRY